MQNLKCTHIDAAVKLALAEGNEIKAISDAWTKIDLAIDMKMPLTDSLHQKIISVCPSLVYWSSEATPHNCADEGFTCEACKVLLAFPK